MRPTGTYLLCLLLAVVTASRLGAQAKSQAALERLFGQPLVEGYSLLRLPKVQKELGLTRAQTLRIIARDQAAEALIETATPPPKTEDIPALTKQQEAIREKAIGEVLTEPQRKRLLQMLAQQLGATLLLRKEMEQDLKLTDTQRYKLYVHYKDTVEKVKAVPAEKLAGAFTGHAREAKIRQIRETGYKHMVNELTPEQRKRYRELLGPPLKLE